MSKELLARLGFFFRDEFLGPESCEQILREAMASTARQGTIIRGGDDAVVDTTARRVEQADLSTQTNQLLISRLELVKPELERHFKVTLEGSEDPVCLTYKPGDFYVPHHDVARGPDAPDLSRRRTVSAIVFLNTESEHGGEGSYSGGSVAFYGVMNMPGLEKHGVALKGRSGLLVAFRSDILHEVYPVTAGTRNTIVTWFYK